MVEIEIQARSNRADIRYVRCIVTGMNNDGRSCNLSLPDHYIIVGQVVRATGDSITEGNDPVPEGHKFAFHSDDGTILRNSDFAPNEA